ncbi:hypothetical protein Tco_0573285 [Tanacetum coccineum]
MNILVQELDLLLKQLSSHKQQILRRKLKLRKRNTSTSLRNHTINESLENVVLAKSSYQSQSTYKAATSLTEFELKKILLDKLEKSKLYRAAEQHRDLYDTLVKTYQLDKDLFDSYGEMYSLKRGHEDKDKDEDPPAISDQGLKKRKTNTEMPQDQGDDLGNTEDQPNVKEASKHDWFKKPERLPTPDRKSPTTFDELMSTPIDFLAYVLHNLKIENLTQEHLVGPAFNLLKGTCQSRVGLEFHFEECYKYDYGYLEEIIVRREDQSLHKFVEGDFPRLNLRDIEDMLFVLVQKNLSNLERDDLFDLNIALRMFTRWVVILKRVEDLQLGVKSYQKKFNLTRPKTVLHDIASNRKRSRIMIKAIDQ